MASISDLIMQQVKSAAGGVQIPSNVQPQILNGMASSVLGSLTQTAARPGGVQIPAASRNQILNGMSSSVLGSLTQTAAQPGGLDAITALFTGKANAASWPWAERLRTTSSMIQPFRFVEWLTSGVRARA